MLEHLPEGSRSVLAFEAVGATPTCSPGAGRKRVLLQVVEVCLRQATVEGCAMVARNTSIHAA
jgi:hypothetical protein